MTITDSVVCDADHWRVSSLGRGWPLARQPARARKSRRTHSPVPRARVFSCVVTDNPFRHAMRFLVVLTLHRYPKDGLNGVRKFLHGMETHAGANLRVGAYRRRKADSIQTVVDAHPDAALDLDRLSHEVAHQRQYQETMRDRRAVGRFSLRTFAVHMNPLPVFNGFGKLPNAVLRYPEPIRHRDLASQEIVQGTRCLDHKWRHEISF